MKTGRLELYIEDSKRVLRPVLDENDEPVKCETRVWMEELMKKYLPQLKENEFFRIKENW